MYVETVKFHGLPPRGSLQDRITCEMLLRVRTRKVSENVYLGRLLAANMNLNENMFQLWTELYSLEVFHNTYNPATVSSKAKALEVLKKRLIGDTENNSQMFRKLQRLTVKESDMRPTTAKEREAAKQRLRRLALKKATRKR